MSFSQPGQVQKFDSGITLSSDNDIPFSSLTVCSGYRFLYNGSQFCLAQYDENTHRMEMNVWNNDGSVATNFFFSEKYLLDINYDKTDGVYYGLRWNNSIRGTGYSFSPVTEGGVTTSTCVFHDSFVDDKDWHIKNVQGLRVDRKIDYNPPSRNTIEHVIRRWTDYSNRSYNYVPAITSTPLWGNSANISSTLRSVALNLIEVDDSVDSAVYYSNLGVGYLNFDVEVNGDFVARLDLNVTSLTTNSLVSFRVLGQQVDTTEPFSQLGSVCYRGSHTDPRIQVYTVNYTNDSAYPAWYLTNLRINERYLDSVGGGITSITNSGTETYKVKIEEYYNHTTLIGGTTDDKAIAFSVKNSSGTSFGYGILGSNNDIVRDHSTTTGGDTHRSFSWVGSSGQVMAFDAKVGYYFDANSALFKDYIDASTVSTSVDVAVGMLKESVPVGISNDKIRLAIKRTGSTIYFMKRDNTVVDGAYTVVDSFDSGYTGPVRFEIFADATAGGTSPDIKMSNLVVRSLLSSEVVGIEVPCSASWPHPVFSLETYDRDGNKKEAPSVSDAFGNVIKSFDIIHKGIDSGGDFYDYYTKSQLASNHGSNTTGGEVYINVNRDFYKYLKSDLPITTTESGVAASKIEYGSLFGTPYYNTLNWNTYTEGGLIYAAVNDTDVGNGIYFNVIRHTTMLPNDPVKFSWLDESDPLHPLYGVDVDQPYLMYGLSVSDRKVYIYNMEEDVSAFCNVISQKQIVGANTSETSLVTAQVMNVYGDPLLGKTVTFSVSVGDGSVSPASDVTDALGEAITTYTVGSTVGTATIRATVSN